MPFDLSTAKPYDPRLDLQDELARASDAATGKPGGPPADPKVKALQAKLESLPSPSRDITGQPKRTFDLASAKPAAAPAPVPKPAPKDDQRPTALPMLGPVALNSGLETSASPKDILGGAVEPLLSMAFGALAQPLAGMSGLGASILGSLGMKGMDPAAHVRNVQEGMTYQPRTQGGKDAMRVIGAVPELIGAGAEWAGRKTQDITGSPGLAAQVETAGKFIPGMLGAKATKGALPEGAPRVLDPHSQELVSRGVRTTPGELLGGGWARAEQAMQSLPFVGEFVKSARQRSVRDFNLAALNDALEPVGIKVPKALEAGNNALAWAYGKYKAKYDEVLGQTVGRLGPPKRPGMPNTPAPLGSAPPPTGPSLQGDLDNLMRMARGSNMPLKYVQELDRIIQREVIDRFEPLPAEKPKPRTAADIAGGARGPAKGPLLENRPERTMAEQEAAIDAQLRAARPTDTGKPAGKAQLVSGETIKTMQNNLRELAETKRKSENDDIRQQALALDEVSASIDRMLQRENPKWAQELENLDEAYGKFKIVQRAAASKGAKEGVFTPSQFMDAVRAKDTTKDKRAYMEGKARMQKLGQAGEDLLAPTLADSGTPYRLLMADAVLGGGALGGHLLAGPAGAIPAAAIPMLYSPAGIALMNKLLTGPRPSGALPAAGGVASLFNQPQP